MILVILFLKIFQKLNFAKSISKIIFKIKNSLGRELKKKGYDTFFTIGFLNGFLPFGLVYMAIFVALTTSNAFARSLYMYMFLFGLGAIPLITAIVYLGGFATRNIRKNIKKAIPNYGCFYWFTFYFKRFRFINSFRLSFRIHFKLWSRYCKWLSLINILFFCFIYI